ncbi:MAG: relaxase/mobilization nuclease domain-containing protein [Ruminococcus sp.]|nr:relaxase/mobilization nuclease domain-containing protein [Ruminococcus sp.]
MPIFKAAKNKKCHGKGGFKTNPRPTLEYITRSDKAAVVSSFYLNDDKDYAKQFDETKRLWGKAMGKNSRKYYHFIHSFSAYDNITPEQAHQLTEELCRQSFPDSELVIATHTDTSHVHCHIVINSVNFSDGKMLQISPKAYTAIKDLSNELAIEQGFIPVDFRKPSAEPVRQSQAERQIMLRGGISWKQELCEVIDMAVKTAKDMKEFEDILNQYGIELTRNTEKTIAYKHPNRSKAIRGEKLGRNYTKEAILNGIAEFTDRADGIGEHEIYRQGYPYFTAGNADFQSDITERTAYGEDEDDGSLNAKQHEYDEYHRNAERELERQRAEEKRRRSSYWSR